MAGSSNTLNVSAPTAELKFLLASNVNVSNFVSVKLSGHRNYDIWKAQMHCLIKSQALLHIIDADTLFPEDKGVHMIGQYDQLVKGWILGSLKENLLKDLLHFDFAGEVWRQLESLFYQRIKFIVGYPRNASEIKLSHFVSVKLSGPSNYHSWKAQMLSLIESQRMLHIIDPTVDDNPTVDYNDEYVTQWILGSMSKNLLKDFQVQHRAHDLWKKLETLFNPPVSNGEGDSSNATEDLKYIQASNVNVSCFVSTKLSGPNNYKIWKAQMICLIESQQLLYIINAEYPYPVDKGVHMIWKYDKLIKGWIFGSLITEVLTGLIHLDSARDVWKTLELVFDRPTEDGEASSVGFKFGTDLREDVPELQSIHKRLYEAVVEGDWWKAKSILKIHENAATAAITTKGNTILHIAVEMGHNYFLEKLLKFFKNEKDIETQNDKGQTALHIAAMVNNEYAAQLLIQKRKELLLILDVDQNSAMDTSIFSGTDDNVSAYLVKSGITYHSIYPNDYSRLPAFAIMSAITASQYDLALKLLLKYTEDPVQGYEVLLFVTTINFPAELSFTESFIYPSFHNVYQKTLLRGSMLFHCNFFHEYCSDFLQAVTIYDNRWCGFISTILLVPLATLYPLYPLIYLLILLLRLIFSTLYFLMWKVFAVSVPPIKNIEKKKKEHKEAKKLLSCICSQMDTSNNDHFRTAIIDAVCQDSYEVVDEILFRSPSTINCMDDEGYNVIQLAIINRSEKVYNLICHLIERISSYRMMTDSCRNNLVHLAARLAPSVALSRTTGAALQLQRELIWLEEMKKKYIQPSDYFVKNSYNETIEMIFNKEHQDLLRQGESWMKTTAESCSITAALIVTIVFAAAITVPGGSNQESGIPVFKKEIAFTIFAISNAFSLFTATTALLLFLSILTARFSKNDFRVTLPRRLVFGLSTLFVSTVAMIVAFGAILFLVFCDRKPQMLPLICVFACLPISVIVTIKLPLLIDLIQSTYSPIFGKKNYLECCKVNRKNTIFTE